MRLLDLKEGEFIPLDELTYEELDFIIGEYVQGHLGFGTALDFTINAVMREFIKKFTMNHGQGYLGKINSDSDGTDLSKIMLHPYVGQKIYNFQFDFILPINDSEIVNCIKQYNTRGYYHPNVYMSLIEKIMERIKLLKGEHLFWE